MLVLQIRRSCQCCVYKSLHTCHSRLLVELLKGAAETLSIAAAWFVSWELFGIPHAASMNAEASKLSQFSC